MSKTVYDDMLAAYGLTTERQRRQAIHEVDQQVVLAGLYNGGFFDEAAFYGGTCLRVFHSLERFSEDMDFSLIKPDSEFELQKYFQPIVDEFAMMGRRVEIRMKDKRSQSAVESAFLKDNTEMCDVVFQTDKSIKIKIEVDTCPPMGFRTEQRLLLMPQSFMTRCYSLPDLFAGKAHAIVYRTWNNRVKGRDWYDFEWYVRHNVPLHFDHLAQRVRQFGGVETNPSSFLERLRERFRRSDIRQAKADVEPFVKNPRELDIWSNDYFVKLTEMMRMV